MMMMMMKEMNFWRMMKTKVCCHRTIHTSNSLLSLSIIAFAPSASLKTLKAGAWVEIALSRH